MELTNAITILVLVFVVGAAAQKAENDRKYQTRTIEPFNPVEFKCERSDKLALFYENTIIFTITKTEQEKYQKTLFDAGLAITSVTISDVPSKDHISLTLIPSKSGNYTCGWGMNVTNLLELYIKDVVSASFVVEDEYNNSTIPEGGVLVVYPTERLRIHGEIHTVRDTYPHGTIIFQSSLGFRSVRDDAHILKHGIGDYSFVHDVRNDALQTFPAKITIIMDLGDDGDSTTFNFISILANQTFSPANLKSEPSPPTLTIPQKIYCPYLEAVWSAVAISAFNFLAGIFSISLILSRSKRPS